MDDMTSCDKRPAANRSIPVVGRRCMVTSILAFLLAVAAPSAKAVPLFCSDISHFPNGLLTGCNLDNASPFAGTAGEYPSGGIFPGASQAVDVLLSQAHQNPLVQVGPDGLTDETPEGKVPDEIPHDKGALEGISAPPDATTSLGDTASTFNKSETWYTMNVDSDGTYLFWGDPEQLDKLDEWSTSEAPDDGLPKGIGIGKKWHF
jgi:hypothetical protein